MSFQGITIITKHICKLNRYSKTNHQWFLPVWSLWKKSGDVQEQGHPIDREKEQQGEGGHIRLVQCGGNEFHFGLVKVTWPNEIDVDLVVVKLCRFFSNLRISSLFPDSNVPHDFPTQQGSTSRMWLPFARNVPACARNLQEIHLVFRMLFFSKQIKTPDAFSNGVRKDKYSDKMDRYFVDFKDQSSHKQSLTEVETHSQESQAGTERPSFSLLSI